MKRGRLELIGDFICKVHDNPNLSPSQLSGYTGLNYPIARKIIESHLIKQTRTTKGKRNLVLTEAGKQALQHYLAFIEAVGDCLQ